MGYELHITRRKHWFDEGADITANEWLDFVRNDAELELQPGNGPHFAIWLAALEGDHSWLDWSQGTICSKNPDAALIDKMTAIAKHFSATVQGDDGEIYDSGNEPPHEPELSLWNRLCTFWQRLRPVRAGKIERANVPFKVGDRVAILGNRGSNISSHELIWMPNMGWV